MKQCIYGTQQCTHGESKGGVERRKPAVYLPELADISRQRKDGKSMKRVMASDRENNLNKAKRLGRMHLNEQHMHISSNIL